MAHATRLLLLALAVIFASALAAPTTKCGGTDTTPDETPEVDTTPPKELTKTTSPPVTGTWAASTGKPGHTTHGPTVRGTTSAPDLLTSTTATDATGRESTTTVSPGATTTVDGMTTTVVNATTVVPGGSTTKVSLPSSNLDDTTPRKASCGDHPVYKANSESIKPPILAWYTTKYVLKKSDFTPRAYKISVNEGTRSCCPYV
jgi:hypothetical protein